jgi:MFS family permease
MKKRSSAETAVSERSTDQRQTFFEVLRQRDFALLWTGQLFSQIGDQCLLIAAITLVTNLSASPLAMLIPAISIALPQVIFGLVGGVVADRWDRKWVMVATDLLRALFVLAVLLVRTTGQLWILYVAAGGLAFMGAFFYPARNAAIPNLVPSSQLLTANGLIQGSYLIALILGPTVAGMAVELWGLPSTIVLDSASFVISAITIMIIRVPPIRGDSALASQKNMWRDMRVGLDFIRHSRPLRRVLSITGVATLGVGAVVLLAIPHLKSHLGAGGLEFGGAISVLGIGSLLGGLIVTRLSRRLATNSLVGGMLVLAGVAVIAFAYAPNYIIVLVSVMMLGLCIVVARGVLDTLTQTLSPDEVRGRVQSTVTLIVVAGTAAAEGLSAVLGHFLGVQTVFVAAGLITVAAGIAATYALREAAQSAQAAVTAM